MGTNLEAGTCVNVECLGTKQVADYDLEVNVP